LPPYDPDVARPLVTLGRGSPTGVACYRHTRFPAHYHGGVFLLDWTFGKIHFVRLERAGASYRGTSEGFLEAVGSSGFAAAALLGHPETGGLYVSVGGRGTRGGVYRIRYARDDGRKSAPLAVRPSSLDWQPALHDEVLAALRDGDDPARLRA